MSFCLKFIAASEDVKSMYIQEGTLSLLLDVVYSSRILWYKLYMGRGHDEYDNNEGEGDGKKN